MDPMAGSVLWSVKLSYKAADVWNKSIARDVSVKDMIVNDVYVISHI